MSVEFYIPARLCLGGEEIITAMRKTSPDPAKVTRRYEGNHALLMIWGAGSPHNAVAIDRQQKAGLRTVSWDYGYFGREKVGGYYRVSVDRWHPQHLLDSVDPAPGRFEQHGISLREDADLSGHILLVGMGPKSHRYLNSQGWEARKLAELRRRFPGVDIVYRPKRARSFVQLPAKTVMAGPIEDLLRGCRLVVCRHSNVAVDAVVAGVPFECEDGAGAWLTGKPYDAKTRLDFLRRLAWFQWRADEASDAWKFLRHLL